MEYWVEWTNFYENIYYSVLLKKLVITRSVSLMTKVPSCSDCSVCGGAHFPALPFRGCQGFYDIISYVLAGWREVFQYTSGLEVLACSFISDFNYMGKIFVIKFPELNLAGIYLLKVNKRNTRTLLTSFWFLYC